MITIPQLNSCTDIADTDVIMVTTAQGQSYKMAGSELNKRNGIIIANSTTVTGPALHEGSAVRIYFTAQIDGVNASSAMVINYNGSNKAVTVPKDGSLVNYAAKAVGNSFVFCQAYTTLELLFNGTNFVIIGNPVVVSNEDYTIYADGNIEYSANYINNIVDNYHRLNTDDTQKTYLIGRTINNDISQSFTNLHFKGGRVDGVYGDALLAIYGNAQVASKLSINMSNVQIILTINNGKCEVYATLDSYTTLSLQIAKYSKFEEIFQEQNISGTVIWQNQWS